MLTWKALKVGQATMMLLTAVKPPGICLRRHLYATYVPVYNSIMLLNF